jgi:hypothetical protein
MAKAIEGIKRYHLWSCLLLALFISLFSFLAVMSYNFTFVFLHIPALYLVLLLVNLFAFVIYLAKNVDKSYIMFSMLEVVLSVVSLMSTVFQDLMLFYLIDAFFVFFFSLYSLHLIWGKPEKISRVSL